MQLLYKRNNVKPLNSRKKTKYQKRKYQENSLLQVAHKKEI